MSLSDEAFVVSMCGRGRGTGTLAANAGAIATKAASTMHGPLKV
jgi:hypothetical protein